MEYFIFWVDVYVGGYRKGATHATPDNGSQKTLCGIDHTKHHMDGGYQNVKVLMPECKKCLKLLENKLD